MNIKELFESIISKSDGIEFWDKLRLQNKLIIKNWIKPLDPKYSINDHMMLGVTSINNENDVRKSLRYLISPIINFIFCGNKNKENEVDGLFTKLTEYKYNSETSSRYVFKDKIQIINKDNLDKYLLEIDYDDIKEVELLFHVMSVPKTSLIVNDEDDMISVTCLLRVNLNDELKSIYEKIEIGKTI